MQIADFMQLMHKTVLMYAFYAFFTRLGAMWLAPRPGPSTLRVAQPGGDFSGPLQRDKFRKNYRKMWDKCHDLHKTFQPCKRLKTCNEFGLKSRMNSVYPLLNMSHICVSLRHVVFSHGTLWHYRLIFTKNELLWLLVALVTVLPILCTRLARPRVRDEKMRMTRVFS